jgi:putative transposase
MPGSGFAYSSCMGRPKRAAKGGLIYHVLNRANARMMIFDKDEDFEAFERTLIEAIAKFNMRLLSYCLMGNHWHLVVWPRKDEDLSRFTGWLTLTHTQRWHAHQGTTGSGHVYQGRFKSFPVQDDEHFYTVCRYVERNALRAGLVKSADEWRWSSLHIWKHGTAEQKAQLLSGKKKVSGTFD